MSDSLKKCLATCLFALSLLPFSLFAESSDHHSVFSFFDNRFLAHPIFQLGFASPMGAPQGAKYVWGGQPYEWFLRRSIDGVPIAFPRGTGSDFSIPLSKSQAEHAEILVVRIKNGGKRQALTLFLNGQKLGREDLPDRKWITLSFPIPQGTAKEGENRIRLKFRNSGKILGKRSGGAISQIALVPKQTPVPEQGLDLSFGPDELLNQRTLRLSYHNGLAYYLYPISSGTIELLATPQGQGCSLHLHVIPEKGTPFDDVKTLNGDRVHLQWTVDPWIHQMIRLEWTAEGDPSCQAIDLLDPMIMVPGPAPHAPKNFPKPKYIVFWLIDTLRADHLKLYNPNTDVQTPHIDALAKQGVLFEHALIQGNESKVSHASIFTGTYPIVHGHLSGKTKVKSSFELIPEAMKRAGLITAGFISNGYISEGWGFKQGWDRYKNTIREGGGNNAKKIFELATHWMDKTGLDKPFFLYLGTIDPHVTYNRHSEFITLYDPNDQSRKGKRFYKKCSGKTVESILSGKIKLSKDDKKRIHALYKNEISFNDKYLGKLIEDLKKRGIFEQTLFVITADHGDEFWEHGSIGHAKSLYEDQVRVPLIFYYPPLFPQNTRVHEGVDVLDIYPTLTQALGIDPPEIVQGESLIPIANGVGRGYPRPSIATFKNISYTLAMEDWKIIVKQNGDARLFNVKDDPTEQTDVSDQHPMIKRWLTDSLSLFLAYDKEWRKRTFGVASNLKPSFPEAISKLKERNR